MLRASRALSIAAVACAILTFAAPADLRWVPEIVAGDMDELVDRLTREHQVDELKLLTEAA